MFLKSVAFVLLTIVCWGMYGPVLHKGQAAMAHSRWRPLICVGVAYFAIAVVVPVLIMQTGAEADAHFTATGTIWSLAGGAAGAVGALGIILAFNYGGRPSWVMPLVFGCAPVVNAFLTIYWAGTWKEISPFFLAGLILVAMGAAMVLVFTPSGHAPPKPAVAAATSEAGGAAGHQTSIAASHDEQPAHSEAAAHDDHDASPSDKSDGDDSNAEREPESPSSS